MALKRSVTVNGTVYPEAYSRITSFRGDKDDAYIYVCTYENEQARIDEAFPILAFEYQSERNDINGDIYVKGYEHLKTLTDFEGATDC